MEIYRVKESDLIGDIKDYPIEIVQKMVERQYEQTGESNVMVFQKRDYSGRKHKGFNWGDTKEGYDFWNEIIVHKLFSDFFSKYPKQQVQEQEEDCWVNPEGVRMLVWDGNEDPVERIVVAKLPKNAALSYMTVNQHCERKFKKGEVYTIIPYKYAKPIPKIKEITMQEIADKLGLSINDLKMLRLWKILK